MCMHLPKIYQCKSRLGLIQDILLEWEGVELDSCIVGDSVSTRVQECINPAFVSWIPLKGKPYVENSRTLFRSGGRSISCKYRQ